MIYKKIYYRYKLRLHQFSHVISKMTVFALVFGFLKMSGYIVNVFKVNIKQLTNIHNILLAISSSLL